jgi:glucoamylase
LAAGHDAMPFVRAMERLASATGLLPEQVWDSADQPQVYMYSGRPTGSAMPLMWAHAEYIKLLRSVRDGKVSDLIADVAKRYLGERVDCRLFEVWKPARQVRSVKRGYVLRIQVPVSFRLHWSGDEWQTTKDILSSTTTLGVEFVDVPIPAAQQAPIRFTFYRTATERWEGRDYVVAVV